MADGKEGPGNAFLQQEQKGKVQTKVCVLSLKQFCLFIMSHSKLSF